MKIPEMILRYIALFLGCSLYRGIGQALGFLEPWSWPEYVLIPAIGVALWPAFDRLSNRIAMELLRGEGKR
jgi:hypothetical protein